MAMCIIIITKVKVIHTYSDHSAILAGSSGRLCSWHGGNS